MQYATKIVFVPKNYLKLFFSVSFGLAPKTNFGILSPNCINVFFSIFELCVLCTEIQIKIILVGVTNQTTHTFYYNNFFFYRKDLWDFKVVSREGLSALNAFYFRGFKNEK